MADIPRRQQATALEDTDHLEVGRQSRALIIQMCARIARRSGTWRRRILRAPATDRAKQDTAARSSAEYFDQF